MKESSSAKWVVFPFKTKSDVTWRRCFHPYTLVPILTRQPSSAPPAFPWLSPPSPLSSPSLLPGCVSQDHRSIQRSSWRRTAGKPWKPRRWNCGRTNSASGKGAQVSEAWAYWKHQCQSCHFVEDAPVEWRQCGVHQGLEIIHEWSNRAGNVWRWVFIWSRAYSGRFGLFPAVSVYFGAADGGMLRSALRQMFARLVIMCAHVWACNFPGPLGVRCMLSTGVSVITSYIFIVLFLVHRNVPDCLPGSARRKQLTVS